MVFILRWHQHNSHTCYTTNPWHLRSTKWALYYYTSSWCLFFLSRSSPERSTSNCRVSLRRIAACIKHSISRQLIQHIFLAADKHEHNYTWYSPQRRNSTTDTPSQPPSLSKYWPHSVVRKPKVSLYMGFYVQYCMVGCHGTHAK